MSDYQKEKRDKGYFAQLCSQDVMSAVAQPLATGLLKMGTDQIIRPGNKRILAQRPWVSSKICPDRMCFLWKDILFEYYQFIPKACRMCWKVTCHVPTVEDAFNSLDHLRRYDAVGKVGMENRGYTGHVGQYLVVWYLPLGDPLEKQREEAKLIKKKFRREVKHDATVNLRRGCTEMEKKYYPADSWEILASAFDTDEEKVSPHFADDDNIMEQPYLQEINAKSKWIDRAFEHGDLTYLKYVEMPHIPPRIDWMNSIHASIDFPSSPVEEGEVVSMDDI